MAFAWIQQNETARGSEMPLTAEAEVLGASLNQRDHIVIMAMEWVAVTREVGMQ
jgi:hypothetical protein